MHKLYWTEILRLYPFNGFPMPNMEHECVQIIKGVQKTKDQRTIHEWLYVWMTYIGWMQFFFSSASVASIERVRAAVYMKKKNQLISTSSSKRRERRKRLLRWEHKLVPKRVAIRSIFESYISLLRNIFRCAVDVWQLLFALCIIKLPPINRWKEC